MKPGALYCIDTSALVRAHEYYKPEAFVDFWSQIQIAVNNGTIVAPKQVKQELLTYSEDYLHKWAKSQKHMFSKPNNQVFHCALEIIRKVSKFSGASGTKDFADPWVIAMAKVQRRYVVTAETESHSPVDPHIPDICHQFGVEPITISKMIEYMGWRFVKAPS